MNNTADIAALCLKSCSPQLLQLLLESGVFQALRCVLGICCAYDLNVSKPDCAAAYGFYQACDPPHAATPVSCVATSTK